MLPHKGLIPTGFSVGEWHGPQISRDPRSQQTKDLEYFESLSFPLQVKSFTPKSRHNGDGTKARAQLQRRTQQHQNPLVVRLMYDHNSQPLGASRQFQRGHDG